MAELVPLDCGLRIGGMSYETPADKRRRARLVRDALADCPDPAVRAAMAELPRHLFCLPGSAADAYEDRALAIGAGQTISQPSLIAQMLSALRLAPGQRVLDIGSGSGYATALLAQVVGSNGQVTAIERIGILQEQAKSACALCLLPEIQAVIEWHHQDGSSADPSSKQYDAIHVACVFETFPDQWLDQLVEGGRLVIPVGDKDHQELILAEKINASFECKKLTDVLFVPRRDGTE